MEKENPKFTGKLILIEDIKQISDKFKTRNFVLKTDDHFPQFVQFQLINSNCAHIDVFNIGDEITAEYSIGGRAWTKDGITKYFNSVTALRITADRSVDKGMSPNLTFATPTPKMEIPERKKPEPYVHDTSDQNDLPFK